ARIYAPMPIEPPALPGLLRPRPLPSSAPPVEEPERTRASEADAGPVSAARTAPRESGGECSFPSRAALRARPPLSICPPANRSRLPLFSQPLPQNLQGSAHLIANGPRGPPQRIG